MTKPIDVKKRVERKTAVGWNAERYQVHMFPVANVHIRRLDESGSTTWCPTPRQARQIADAIYDALGIKR
jgi:hypothetical protein